LLKEEREKKKRTGQLSQGAILGNNEEYAKKFAERSLTLSLGQENELVLENGSGNKGAGETN
jgi:hypothetical protein